MLMLLSYTTVVTSIYVTSTQAASGTNGAAQRVEGGIINSA
jgi:hypothetical protein